MYNLGRQPGFILIVWKAFKGKLLRDDSGFNINQDYD